MLISSPVQAADTARSAQWRTRAVTALNQFLATESTVTMPSFAYGMATGAAANLYGWSNSTTQSLLAKMRATKKTDGTYGLENSWDAFQDGTINPASTGYAVTIAGHVGPTLLDGYLHGAIPKAEVQSLINILMAFPRVAVDRGACVAYSNSGYDNGYCVHNVNAGVAWFLAEANAAGLGATGMQALITKISIQEAIAYHENTWFWPYSNYSASNQDADHNSYSLESMYRLMYWVGREGSYQMMTKNWTDNAAGPIVHTRLVGLPGGPGSNSGGTTLWCVLGDSVSTEQDNYLASVTGQSAAQFAYYASRAAISCA